jgi:hypothetical protein
MAKLLSLVTVIVQGVVQSAGEGVATAVSEVSAEEPPATLQPLETPSLDPPHPIFKPIAFFGSTPLSLFALRFNP